MTCPLPCCYDTSSHSPRQPDDSLHSISFPWFTARGTSLTLFLQIHLYIKEQFYYRMARRSKYGATEAPQFSVIKRMAKFDTEGETLNKNISIQI